jgi:hypothetical protein
LATLFSVSVTAARRCRLYDKVCYDGLFSVLCRIALLYDRSPRRYRRCHASTSQQSRHRERYPGEAKEQRHTALAVEHSAQHRTGGHAEVAREVVDPDRGGALPNEGTREDRRLHRQGEAEQEAEESAVDQRGAQRDAQREASQHDEEDQGDRVQQGGDQEDTRPAPARLESTADVAADHHAEGEGEEGEAGLVDREVVALAEDVGEEDEEAVIRILELVPP